VKDPLGLRFVLPRTRCHQIANDRRCAGAAHLFGGVGRTRQAAYLMAARHQDLDQFGAKEAVSFSDEHGRSR
jgi:hypothetical protein